jgi:hypothetical protein
MYCELVPTRSCLWWYKYAAVYLWRYAVYSCARLRRLAHPPSTERAVYPWHHSITRDDMRAERTTGVVVVADDGAQPLESICLLGAAPGPYATRPPCTRLVVRCPIPVQQLCVVCARSN